MIDVYLAEKFVKRAGSYTKYNVNIMDERGIIIASSDAARVGSFHEIAYRLITTDQDIAEVTSEDHFQGGRTGINIALKLKGRKIGALGISGDPMKIRDAAHLLHMAVETMLEYEQQNKKVLQKQNLSTRFMDGLLYQEEADKEGELTAISTQLGFNPKLSRLPVLVCFDRSVDAYHLLEEVKKYSLLSLQDISMVTRNNEILVYKSFSDQKFSGYRETIRELVNDFSGFLGGHQLIGKFLVGTFQDRYCNYRKGYQHCNWLKKQKDPEENTLFFYDYVEEYMKELVPVIELNRIFSGISEELQKEKKETLIQIVEVLNRNNYNLNEASKEMFIHKNTLIYRFNRIRTLFGINPMQSITDREFLNWLVFYLKKNQ